MIKFYYCPKLFNDKKYFSGEYKNKEIEKNLEENNLLIKEKDILPVYSDKLLSENAKMKIEETILFFQLSRQKVRHVFQL